MLVTRLIVHGPASGRAKVISSQLGSSSAARSEPAAAGMASRVLVTAQPAAAAGTGPRQGNSVTVQAIASSQRARRANCHGCRRNIAHLLASVGTEQVIIPHQSAEMR